MDNVKKFGEDLRKMLSELVTVTPDDLQRLYSETINKTILETEHENGLHYVGGEFSFECVDDENFTCNYSLYFCDEQKKFFKKSATTGNLSMEPLSTEMRDELTAEKVIKYEIPEPSDEAREAYEREHSKAK